MKGDELAELYITEHPFLTEKDAFNVTSSVREMILKTVKDRDASPHSTPNVLGFG